MKRYLPFVIVALVALATIGSGAMLYRARRPHVLSIPENKTVSAKGDAGAPHIRGNPDAPVTLEEYGDFQCPPCGMFATFLGQHEHAREAALAAEAAGLQGRFWEMHDVLYREQETWSKAPNVRELFESYAGTIGLDVDKFKKDMDGGQVKARVEADRQRGQSLGIQITPTLFINNQPLDPKDKNPEGIRAEINAALEKKTQT